VKTLIIKVFKYSYRGGEKCVCAGVFRESNTVLASPTTVISPWTMYLSTQHGVPFWCNTDTNESTWKDPTKDAGAASSGSGAGASPNEQKDTHTQIFAVRLKVPAARAYRAYVDMPTPHFENVVWV